MKTKEEIERLKSLKMDKTREEILAKYEDDNEYHFHDCDKKWICEAMEEYGAQQRALGFEEGNIEKLITQYIKEELPDANSPYHHEAEIAAGFEYFIEWVKKKRFYEN